MLNVLVPIEETRAYQSIFAKGKADGLKRLLARRFGPLSAWAAKRIDATAIDQLNAWLEGIFEAGRLENLIGPKSRRGKEAQRSSPPTLFPRHRQVRVEEEQGFPGMFRVVVTQRWRGGLGLSG